jgi:hypothetical protein
MTTITIDGMDITIPTGSAVVMTYDSLFAQILNYTERTDQEFIDTVPTIIALAESSIAAALKTYLQLTVVETTLTANQSVLNKPARWKKTVSMKTNGNPIKIRGQDYVAYFQSESTNAQPLYYAEYDYNNWAFAPIPDQSYPVEIIYYSEIQPLDSQNQQNLFTRETPQLMLYACMYHAMTYLKALDKIDSWKSYYNDELQAVKKEDNSRRLDRNVTVQEP